MKFYPLVNKVLIKVLNMIFKYYHDKPPKLGAALLTTCMNLFAWCTISRLWGISVADIEME